MEEKEARENSEAMILVLKKRIAELNKARPQQTMNGENQPVVSNTSQSRGPSKQTRPGLNSATDSVNQEGSERSIGILPNKGEDKRPPGQQ